MTLPIVEWLRQKELSGSKVVGGERVTNRRNFDGDEAADIIEELVEALAEQVSMCRDPSCEMCGRHERLLAKIGGDALPPNKPGVQPDFRYDALPMVAPECSGDPLAEQFRRDCEAALHNPEIDPIEAADGYRDTPPEDEADELSLAKGEIAWLREFVRRAGGEA